MIRIVPFLLTLKIKICTALNKEKSSEANGLRGNLVGVTGFEPAASTSQMSRATNCATPRNILLYGQNALFMYKFIEKPFACNT